MEEDMETGINEWACLSESDKHAKGLEVMGWEGKGQTEGAL